MWDYFTSPKAPQDVAPPAKQDGPAQKIRRAAQKIRWASAEACGQKDTVGTPCVASVADNSLIEDKRPYDRGSRHSLPHSVCELLVQYILRSRGVWAAYWRIHYIPLIRLTSRSMCEGVRQATVPLDYISRYVCIAMKEQRNGRWLDHCRWNLSPEDLTFVEDMCC